MHPYHDQGFFSFIASLWGRFFLSLCGLLSSDTWVSEDLQFFALILSGLMGLILGFYLIYNRMTMMANSLSHTLLLGLVLTFIFFKILIPGLRVETMPFYILTLGATLTAFLTLMAMRYLTKRLSDEAANAFSFTALFALGIFISSTILKNTHLGLEAVLGNLEALSFIDIQRLFGALVILIVFWFFFKTPLLLISFDPLFATSIGISVARYKQWLICIAAFCLMVCFRALGVILILSLLTAPILTASLFYSDRRKIFFLGFIFVFFQATLTLAMAQVLYVRADLPISSSGLFGFLGLLQYLGALSIKKGLKRTLFTFVRLIQLILIEFPIQQIV